MDQLNPSPKLSKPAIFMKVALIATSIVVLILAVLLAGSALNLNCPFGFVTDQNSSYEAGWMAASQKLEESGLLRPETAEIFTISGTITQISENQIIIKADPTVINPLAMQAPESRTVNITSKTKIIKQTPKTQEELAADEEKFVNEREKLEPEAEPPARPLPYTEKEIKLSELKTADKISVTSDQNIKLAAEINATEIKVNF